MKVKYLILTIVGSLGSLASYLFGGFDKLLIALIIFMIIDFLSGLILAIVFKKSSKTKSGRVSSEAGIKGLAKKIFILFLVALAEQLDIVLGTNLVRDGAVIAFISMEGVSILENSTLAGLPVPRMIKNALEVLSKGEDKKDE
ncbi:holin family protein [Acholeplasma laidlawii]|uniref:Phage-related holin n=2 Tax=Acholeplasma laidlawii TaxID=2148 RepID=A9NFW5_ACHLI|nr:phage holin family protein [Acholeplasma laidlawii]ABX81245.1 phage-related holin [Acholeplasma laidlawii PG-8A]NWH10182.1 phage holin family protein [Acholeplasma laidlawii]NWH11573.1 phage holin family protein [Acholeplasma laidlawii]NWH13018.1 phage holin family protein [Acholeplasma laidlawii]NWH14714.1 phage holin family protein [Acholeplasma laidlawii]